MKKKEPKLCLGCPLPEWMQQEIIKQLMEKQYTLQKEEPSPHRICMERRKALKTLGLTCPYFTETENILYHADEQFKNDLDRKIERRNRQNLQHFL